MATSLSPIDELIAAADQALRTLGAPPKPAKASPAGEESEDRLSTAERRRSGALMRVNHAGEVAAQALYHGQSAFARNPALRQQLQQAAAEEEDHLAWCGERLKELGSRPSRLGPLWYLGCYALGAGTALLGDRVSLGFVAETERQVVDHLKDHLRRLPANDARSASILKQMAEDEARHGESARLRGGSKLPLPARGLMALGGQLLRNLAYRV